jgi:hypothetical protein
MSVARSFRLYEKKRGNRRTGSKKLGSAGEALFSAVLFLLGWIGLAVLVVTLVIPEWRANHEFTKQTCTILDARIGEKLDEEAIEYRPEIQIEYQVGGETYRIWTYDVHTLRKNGYSVDPDEAQAVLDRFVVGGRYACWYNPADADEAVLTRRLNWWIWLTLIVPVSFVVLGAIGLIYAGLGWGRSTERRAALVNRAVKFAPANGNGKSKFPQIPGGTDVTNSPGTRLAFRLPVRATAGWMLSGWAAGALAWNGMVAFFVYRALAGYRNGSPDWLLTAFIVPFAVMGIGLIVFFLRRLLVSSRVGPTMVEISDQPLEPGGRYQLFLSQTGRLKINSLEVLLVCDEGATYRHGTDARTESRRVYQQPVLLREQCRIQPGVPFQADCEFELPPGAMHSFKSRHNEISWKVVVKGRPASWPDYERSFPIIVHPASNGNHEA